MSGPPNFAKKGLGKAKTKLGSMKRPPKSTMKGQINTKPKADGVSKI